MANEKGPEMRRTKQNTDDGQNEKRSYEKKLTLSVEIEGSDKTTMMELLRKVKEECGEVIGCRYKNPKSYELTMRSEEGKAKLMDGLRIQNNTVTASEINKDEMVVSFINLPIYIGDEIITRKLLDWGVTPVSSIRRRVWPGTEIADGTRYMKVRFTETVKSLPYSAKFETAGGAEHFRVIHDRQIKVCRLCIQPGHIVRDCPDFTCFKCGQQGHYARECAEKQQEEQEEEEERRQEKEQPGDGHRSKEATGGGERSPSGGRDADPTAGVEGAGEERMQEEEEQVGEEQDGDGETVTETPTDGEKETETVNGGERVRDAGARETSGGTDGGESEVKMEGKGGLGTSGAAGEGQSGMEWEFTNVTSSEGEVMEKVGEVRKRPQIKRQSKRLGRMEKKAAK
ncbi:uncharacterized protein LOC144409427 [Gasterosteus aculeatus]